MSKTFMRGLALLELVDIFGPLTVTELARRTGLDKSVVSRMMSGCEPDGWVVRAEGKLSLGPRAALLGHSSPTALVIREAEPLVHAVAGVTGMLTQLYGLVGGNAVILTSASGRGPSFPAGLGLSAPLYATAAGMAIAAALDEDQLDRLLPSDPFPDPAAALTRQFAGLAPTAPAAAAIVATDDDPPRAAPSVPRNRRQLSVALDLIRHDGIAVDDGYLHPELGCRAVPWPRAALPCSLACLGPPAELEAAGELVRGALGAAATPGSGRDDVVAAAAAAIHARPSQIMRMAGLVPDE